VMAAQPRAVRSAVELALIRLLCALLRLSRRRAGLVLVYHAIAERQGDATRELVPPHGVTVFEAQLRCLEAQYRLVRAEDLLPAVGTRMRGERFPVAITFDDDLASHAEIAAPILSRFGAPATFFLSGASLEGTSPFWWQRLQQAVDLGLDVPVEGDGIREQAARIERLSGGERVALAEQLERQLGREPADPGLRVEGVRALVATGFEIGFHTLRHDRLTELDDGDLARAMSEGRAPLEAASQHPLTAISYPHGDADARVARAAREAGFRIGFTGRYEPVVDTSDPLLLGRIEPTFGSLMRFAVQLVFALRKRPHR
jgi:peptidoglycan/xylan/chitin deacetylase (PgdA/CDA1 family)